MQDFQMQGIGGGIGGQAGVMKASPAPKQGVATDLDLHIKRLYGLCERIEEIGNSVGGPVPQNATSGSTDSRPVTSLSSRARDIGDVIARIESAVMRIHDAI